MKELHDYPLSRPRNNEKRWTTFKCSVARSIIVLQTIVILLVIGYNYTLFSSLVKFSHEDLLNDHDKLQGAKFISSMKETEQQVSVYIRKVNVSKGHDSPFEGFADETIHKPYFILHVGPPKTGTTSIQCGLTNVSLTLAALDHTYYLGKPCLGGIYDGTMENGESRTFKTHRMVIGELSRNIKGEETTHLQNRLEHHHSLGHNIILSEEALAWRLANSGAPMLRSMLTLWNTIVVLSYRRYHDWIRSRYYHDFAGEYSHSLWPHERKQIYVRDVPTLLSYIEDELKGMESQSDKFSTKSRHMTISTIQQFRNANFSNFLVFFFDNTTSPSAMDMTQNFVCNGLPHQVGYETCSVIRRTPKSSLGLTDSKYSNTTPLGSMDALRLVREAYNRGWIGHQPNALIQNGTFNRMDRMDHNKMVFKTRRRLVNTFGGRKQGVELAQLYNPPEICINPDLQQRLLHATIIYEKYIISQGYLQLPADFEDLKHHFQQSINKRKYCELDVNAVLDLPEWEAFFKESWTQQAVSS